MLKSLPLLSRSFAGAAAATACGRHGIVDESLETAAGTLPLPEPLGTVAAINTIIMILVSIQPFAAKKIFALAATVACLSTASCFADAMYLSTQSMSPSREQVQTAPLSTDYISLSEALGRRSAPRGVTAPSAIGEVSVESVA